jgi:prefoldin alpha subunit
MIGTEKSDNEEAVKGKYSELQMAAAQIKQMEERLEALEGKKQEIEASYSSLDELNKSSVKTKMLAPVADGMFASAILENNNELIVNVGSDICVKKTVEEAKALLGQKLQEIAKYQEDMLEEMARLTDQASMLEKELGEMVQG